MHEDDDEVQIVGTETHVDEPSIKSAASTNNNSNAATSDAAAMTSMKWPASLMPMLPIVIYTAVSASIMTMVSAQIPDMRREYFGSNTKASFWASLFDSSNAFIGLFTSGLFGLAADAFGRRIILLISAGQACFMFAVVWYFGVSNPWPFLVVSNMSSIIGSTKVGNAAVCLMVIADVFEKDCRLVPTIIFIITVFGGVIPGVLPGTLGMSPSDVTLMALIISLAVLLFVYFFVRETLPAEKRKSIRVSDLHNPLVPLRFVLTQRFLAILSSLAVTFLFPFYLSGGIAVYYLDERLNGFTASDNSLLSASMALATVFGLIVLLPILTKLMEVENIVLLGVVAITLNGVVFCVITEPWQAFVLVSGTEGVAFASITLLTQIVSVTVPQNEQGVVNGTLAAFKEIAIITGPILGSLLFAAGQSMSFIQLPFILSILVAGCGVAIVACLLNPEIRRRRLFPSNEPHEHDMKSPVNVAEVDQLIESPVSDHVCEELP